MAEQLVKKQQFKGNCEILMTLFQPRAFILQYAASWKWVNLFSYSVKYFCNMPYYSKKENKSPVGELNGIFEHASMSIDKS